MNKVNFFTPIVYNKETKSIKENILERIDDYFNFFGRKAIVVGRLENGEETVLFESQKLSKLALLKIIGVSLSMFTGVVPLGMLIAKAILRASHTYKVLHSLSELPISSCSKPLALQINKVVINQFTTDCKDHLTILKQDGHIFLVTNYKKIPVEDYLAAIDWASLTTPKFNNEQTKKYTDRTILLKRLFENSPKNQHSLHEHALMAYTTYEVFYSLNRLMREGIVMNKDFKNCFYMSSNYLNHFVYPKEQAQNLCREELIQELLFISLLIGSEINQKPSFNPINKPFLTRNANLPEASFEMLKTARKTHQIVKSHCFMSTSTKEKNDFKPYKIYREDENFQPVTFKITPLPAYSSGKDITQKFSMGHEAEILFKPNTAFIVDDINKQEHKYEILLTEVHKDRNDREDAAWLL